MDRKLMLLMVTPPFHDPGIAPNPLKAAHTMIPGPATTRDFPVPFPWPFAR